MPHLHPSFLFQLIMWLTSNRTKTVWLLGDSKKFLELGLMIILTFKVCFLYYAYVILSLICEYITRLFNFKHDSWRRRLLEATIYYKRLFPTVLSTIVAINTSQELNKKNSFYHHHHHHPQSLSSPYHNGYHILKIRRLSYSTGSNFNVDRSFLFYLNIFSITNMKIIFYSTTRGSSQIYGF